MAKRLAQILGVIVAVIAVFGLAAGEGQALGGLLNVDFGMDLLRVAVAGVLLYAGFGTEDDDVVKGIVGAVGIFYLLFGIVGIFTPSLFGLLPSDLTGFDIFFHLIAGALAFASTLKVIDRNAASFR